MFKAFFFLCYQAWRHPESKKILLLKTKEMVIILHFPGRQEISIIKHHYCI
jgi:hypothetical protein